MLKRYDNKYNYNTYEMDLVERKNGKLILYEDHLSEKQSEKEELKKKVEEIITCVNMLPTNIYNGNDYEEDLRVIIIQKLKSLIGE